MTKQEKSLRKCVGRGLKNSRTKSIGKSTPKIAPSKLIKKLFISILGSNSLQQHDFNALFEEHTSMYGSCCCFGMEEKHSLNVMKIILEAPMEMQVHSLGHQGIDTIYNFLSAFPIIQKQTLCLIPK